MLPAVGTPTVGSLCPRSSANKRGCDPWHLSTRGGRPLPSDHRFRLHEAAQPPGHAGLMWPIPHRSSWSPGQEGEFPQDQHPSAASRHPHFPGQLAPGSPGVTPAAGPAPPLVSAPSVLQGKHSMDFTSPVSFTFFDMFL